jgi:hypothetical protein
MTIPASGWTAHSASVACQAVHHRLGQVHEDRVGTLFSSGDPLGPEPFQANLREVRMFSEWNRLHRSTAADQAGGSRREYADDRSHGCSGPTGPRPDGGPADRRSATVRPSGALEDELAASAAAGFAGVEISEPDFSSSSRSAAEVSTRCAGHGLSINSYDRCCASPALLYSRKSQVDLYDQAPLFACGFRCRADRM